MPKESASDCMKRRKRGENKEEKRFRMTEEDMVNRFTQKAQGALNRALAAAREMGHTYIGTEHLLLGLLTETDSIAARILTARGIRSDSVKKRIEASAGIGEKSAVSASDMTPRTKKVIENSAVESVRAGHGFIGTEHLLLSLTSEGECEAVRIISAEGVSVNEIREDVLLYFGTGDGTPARIPPLGSRRGERDGRDTIRDCPALSAYGRNLCAWAKEGRLDPVIGREEETERVLRILSRRTKNNPCLIGEPGVGKTAVVEGIARRIADGSVPENLRGRMLVMLDISSMIAGAKYRGEFEERMRSVLHEATRDSRVILFIDEIHTIIGAGGAEGALDAANILKPALARGELQVIGATTIDEYRRHIEKDAALERRFQSVLVGEPSAEQARRILTGLRDSYEAHHRLKITDEAIDAAVHLSVRYICDRYLPDKAIDLIDEAAAKKRLSAAMPPPKTAELENELRALTAEKEEAILAEDYENAAALRDRQTHLQAEYESSRGCIAVARRTEETVTAEDIAAVVTAWTGIPVSRLAEEESARLSKLEEELSSRVIGQKEAVAALSRAIRRGRAGLKDPGRPVGSFLFLGPTGVGKTELARALADTMYGGDDALIRVDMSEYMEKFTTSRMIGSPPGYIGYDDGGQLTEQVRRHPYSVVLFDEVEKAHPDVFHLLLQVLEDGTLTDARGRRVDFRNTVIIMTSNIGAAGWGGTGVLGFSPGGESEYEQRKAHVTDALKATFRPEFLNRLDEIILFEKLSETALLEITGRMLAEVTKRIAALGISVHFPDATVHRIAAAGNDPTLGARPLRRAVVRYVEDSFAEAMLGGAVAVGDTVDALWEDGGVVYRVRAANA